MEPSHTLDDGSISPPEDTDDPVTEFSELSTPITFSADASPQPSEQPLPEETLTVVQKKKKKRKPKKSAKAKEAVLKTPLQGGEIESEDRPQVLCINRNKHWRYISSYHGPWLGFDVRILDCIVDALQDLSQDSGSFTTVHPSNASPASPSARSRGFPALEDHTLAESPRVSLTTFSPTTRKFTAPPIDPGVMRSVAEIRRLIDDATNLSVQASSRLSAVELGSIRNVSSFNGVTRAAAQSLGLGMNSGGGRNTTMSLNRVHRLRRIAVEKLAQAYKMDEIASSVVVMQGGSVFDDVAERVLKHDPENADAKYVHFFHEKIPSSHRQLAASTPTTVLDELITAYPHQPEYYRTRGVVHTFHEAYSVAIKDFTRALKEARARRKNARDHHSESRSSKPKKRKGASGGSGHTTGQAPPDGTAVPDGELTPLHPSLRPDAPEPIENQVLFLRGSAYLQQAVHLIERAIIELEGVSKPKGLDGAELRLCCLNNGRYGGVEIGNPDGPLGSRTGAKLKAYREVLAAKAFRDQITSLLRKSVRDHERFLYHLDAGESAALVLEGDIARQVEVAFLVAESIRPGNHNNEVNNAIFELRPALTAYHPLLIESHFSILLCQLMLANFNDLLPRFARTTLFVDVGEGYPVFVPPRSMGQAEFVEVLERLATGWKNGCQPHSLVGNHRGKARLTASTIEVPPLVVPSISTSSIASTASAQSAVSVSTLSPIPTAPQTASVTLLTNAIASIDLNSPPPSSCSSTWGLGSTPTLASAGHFMGPTNSGSSTSSPYVGATAELMNVGSSSSSSALLCPVFDNTNASYSTSAPLSRRSSSHALSSPIVSSPSYSPLPQEPRGSSSSVDKGKRPEQEQDGGDDDDEDQEQEEPQRGETARRALDHARMLLAPVIKRQRERTEQAIADRAKGIKRKKSMTINIPLHGPRVEIILAWFGAVHLPELDGA